MHDGDYITTTSCLLLVNDAVAEVHWRAAAASLGLGLVTARPIAAEFDGSVLPAAGGVLIVDLAGVAELAANILLDHLERWCGHTGSPVVVSFDRADIDRVVGIVGTDLVILLCDPTQADRIIALATALPLPTNRVAEIDPIANVLRLQQLADEVGRIARALAQVPGDPGQTESSVSDGTVSYRPPPLSGSLAPSITRATITPADIRAVLRLRRQREAMFGSELFADPAWDMMLDLAAARLERVDVAISSLCIAAAVPPTTALRWIRTLTELRIFERRSDTRDGRRIFVALSDDTASRILDFLGRAKGTGAMPI